MDIEIGSNLYRNSNGIIEVGKKQRGWKPLLVCDPAIRQIPSIPLGGMRTRSEILGVCPYYGCACPGSDRQHTSADSLCASGHSTRP